MFEWLTNPDFLKLQEEMKQLSLRQNEIFTELERRWPTSKGWTWVSMVKMN